MNNVGVLKGFICTNRVLSGVINQKVGLMGHISIPVGYRTYTGPYEVTPAVYGQELETADKKLSKNVTINKIPSYEVSNSSGGDTFVIGKEL